MTDQSRSMFTEAIAAVQSGNRSRARELLTRLLRIEPSNAEYWLWLSAVAPTHRERLFCLKSALKHDPTNRAALRGMVIMGERRPEQAELNTAIGIPRRAAKGRSAPSGPSSPLPLRWVVAGAAAFTVIGLVFLTSLYLGRPRGAAPTLPPIFHTETQLALAPTATSTPIPADQRINRTPIPAELASTPLSFFLERTPTPTPFLGLTPSSQYEAYQSAVTALYRESYEEALNLVDQVLEMDSGFAGAHYLRGEILRLSDRPREAIAAYDRAVGIQPDYAAAYLGSARAQISVDPDTFPSAYQIALDNDPLMLEAYLFAADYYFERRHYEKSEEVLLSALEAGVSSPELLIELSDAQFLLKKYEIALENAILGSADDPGSLKGYLVLGRAFTALGHYYDALAPLQTYLIYQNEDYRAWGAVGAAYLYTGQPELALEAFNNSIALRDHAPAYEGRGNYYFQNGDFTAALNDYFRARQYGPDSPQLALAVGKSYYYLDSKQDALKEFNSLIASTDNQAIRAEAYAYLAMIFEETDPPFISDAIANWTYVLGIEQASQELRTLAEEHLANLQGDDFQTPTPRSIPAATETPEVIPSATTTSTPPPAQDVITPSPTPTDPRGIQP